MDRRHEKFQQDAARMRMLVAPPPRLPASALTAWRVSLWCAGVAAVPLFVWLIVQRTLWLNIAGYLFGFLAFLFIGERAKALRIQRERELRKRAKLIYDSIINGRPYAIRGTRGYGPLVLALIAMFFVLMALAPRLTPPEGLTFIAAFPLAIVFWIFVAPRLMQPVIVFETDGFTTPALGRISWSGVTGAWLTGSGNFLAPRRSPDALVLEFLEENPRGAGSWWARNMRGIGRFQQPIYLGNSSEDKLLTRMLAEYLLKTTDKPAGTSDKRWQQPAIRVAPRPARAPTRAAKPPPGHATPPRPRVRRVHMLGGRDRVHPLMLSPARDIGRIRREAALQRMAGVIGIVVVMLACVGARVSFFRSPAWTQTCLVVVSLLTIASVTAMIMFSRARLTRGNLILSLLVLPLIAWGLWWMAIAQALPDLYTRVAGTPFAIAQPMHAHYLGASKRACRVYGALFESGNLLPYYSAWSSEFAVLPEQGMMQAHGTGSWFGRHISRVTPLDAPPP